jgi:hypothetical protein
MKYTDLMQKYLPLPKEEWEQKCARLFNNSELGGTSGLQNPALLDSSP